VTTTDDGHKLVHLAIPLRYLEPVSIFLAELEKEDKDRRSPPKPPRVCPPELGGEWPVAELRRFAAGRTRSHATILKVLDLLAKHPNERVSATKICAATGLPMDRFKGAFAGLTRLLKAHSDLHNLGMPFNRHTTRPPDGQLETFYWLTPKQAHHWKLARSARHNAP
jgi:hypothetical protein